MEQGAKIRTTEHSPYPAGDVPVALSGCWIRFIRVILAAIMAPDMLRVVIREDKAGA